MNISSETPKQEFRADINGLRAWAVIVVVLYHFEVPFFQGGFVGVDVFFVISGYLMTQIISRGLETRRFSLLQFYLSRARRILPALLVLCVTLLVVGWKFLLATDYRLLANHVISSLGFFSNFKYWRESGYFDPSSHEKWLLHTWSLSVEWQFYLLLPLALIVAWRVIPGWKGLYWVLGGIFFVSIFSSVVLSGAQPEASFYLLHTRAWELVAGGLAFLVATSGSSILRFKAGLELLGMLLILAATFLFSSVMTWPSAWAVVPVAGTILVLLANRERSVWTGPKAFQWVGLRSYSVYLWHWPVCVALVKFGVDASVFWVSIGIALSFLLGHLSYVGVEVPAQKRIGGMRMTPAVAMLGLSVVLVSSFSLYVRHAQGASWRLPDGLAAINDIQLDRNPRVAECHVAGPAAVPQCRYGGPELGAIVIGDSHAASFVRTIEAALPDPSLHVLDWTMSACPTLAGVKKKRGGISPNCGEFVEWAIGESEELGGSAPLFIINRASAYIGGGAVQGHENGGEPLIYFTRPTLEVTPDFLREYTDAWVSTVCRFAETRPVFLVRPVPEMRRSVPRVMWLGYWLGDIEDVSIDVQEYHARNELVWAVQDAARTQCGVEILDPTPYLCEEGRCYGIRGGVPLYFDSHHLTESGARLTRTMFQDVLRGGSESLVR